MNLATQIVLSVIDKMLQPTNAGPLVMPGRNECGGGVFDYVEIVAKKYNYKRRMPPIPMPKWRNG